ncbi:MAG: shikimate dehydrogenase [Acidimicrobiaceae bacterium]|nr:shikimate dehydrogenase [Acidimicrobiaceae bacterium]
MGVAKFLIPSAGRTAAAVIGDPVLHSLSPTIYNAAFEHDQVNWSYSAVNITGEQVSDALEEMRQSEVGGLSVTMPHKEIVANLVDETTRHAERLGAVNCVSKNGSTLVGHNTDGEGFIKAIEAETKERTEGKSYLVIGAGGAAKAVTLALGEAGASEVIVSSRNASKSRKAASLAGQVGRSGSLSEAEGVDVIINATPIGMRGAGNEDQLPLPVEAMHKGQIIVDLIYHPLQTEFLKNASRIGARTMNGIGMLIHQAALQYTLWTNKEAPLDVMQDAVIQQISK